MKNMLVIIISMVMLSSVAFAAPVEQGLSKKEIMELLVQTSNSAESEAHLALIDQAINKVALASDTDLDAINTAILQNKEVALGINYGSCSNVCTAALVVVLLAVIEHNYL